MKHRDSWFLKVWDDQVPEVFGIGEAGPLNGLSHEKPEMVEKELDQVVKLISGIASAGNFKSLHGITEFTEPLKLSSSVVFCVEAALLDLANQGKRLLFQNSFMDGKPIPINGLVWMGGLDEMLQQVSIKIDEGFTCIKMKIGGINFEKEVDILQFIRRKYFRDVITIRLDANGSIKPSDAYYKLNECAKYDVHSIEQPLKSGAHMLPELCKNTPIPVALDEELIGVSGKDTRVKLIEKIQPQYIILKPSLHGGLRSCEEWISIAEEHKIGWWITSALESNIGLNTIAQFTANHKIEIPQGLGTGMIYDDNIPSPLEVHKGALRLNSQENWDLSDFN